MNSQILTFRRMEQFTDYLFDDRDEARKAALILKAILEARSPRLSDISQKLPGKNPDSNYKMLQRFLKAADPREALLRLYQIDAPFILMDPTEIPRPQAKKTEYVGRLQDGKTRGFWLLVQSWPCPIAGGRSPSISSPIPLRPSPMRGARGTWSIGGLWRNSRS